MSIPMNTECLLCHMKSNVTMARSLGDEQTAMKFAKELMQLHLNMPGGASSALLGPPTDALLVKYYGLRPDRYKEEKAQSNRFVLERLDQLRQRVKAAPDPVYAGLQFSILGNYLDFSALRGQVSFEKLDEMLEEALEMELDRDCYRQFCQELSKGTSLLYVTDNAGEIGFDRIFAEVLSETYPQLRIIFCVRGKIAQNDATREDAQLVGIPFPVIDNGSDIAGTELSLISPEAKEALQAADVVIAKGMGNTETLWGCGYNVYYAFLVKCARFVTCFRKPLMTPIFVREKKQ